MSESTIIDTTTVTGERVLFEARANIKKLKALNVRVPKMQVKGGWKMNGFDFDFEDWQEAFPPLGNKYIKAGEKKAAVEPTETSELQIFFVFSGESLRANDKLATGDLFAKDEDVEEEGDAESEVGSDEEGE